MWKFRGSETTGCARFVEREESGEECEKKNVLFNARSVVKVPDEKNKTIDVMSGTHTHTFNKCVD